MSTDPIHICNTHLKLGKFNQGATQSQISHSVFIVLAVLFFDSVGLMHEVILNYVMSSER